MCVIDMCMEIWVLVLNCFNSRFIVWFACLLVILLVGYCKIPSRISALTTSLSLSQGVSGALAVLMKDAIKPTLMQTLEVSL